MRYHVIEFDTDPGRGAEPATNDDDQNEPADGRISKQINARLDLAFERIGVLDSERKVLGAHHLHASAIESLAAAIREHPAPTINVPEREVHVHASRAPVVKEVTAHDKEGRIKTVVERELIE
jgi:hypothetical protein